MSIGLTLIVDGTIVSGRTIDRAEFLISFARQLDKAWPSQKEAGTGGCEGIDLAEPFQHFGAAECFDQHAVVERAAGGNGDGVRFGAFDELAQSTLLVWIEPVRICHVPR